MLLWYAVFHSGYLQRLDVSVYYGFGSVRGWRHLGLLSALLTGLIDPGPYLVLVLVPIGIALRRHRLIVALGIVAIVLGANGSAELLKHVLNLPRGYAVPTRDLNGTQSFPSGHATAAMTLALCMVLASPPRWRPIVAALGSLGTLAVVYGVLVLGWHYPSDTLGGLLLASIWTLVGIAAIRIVEARTAGRAVANRAPATLGQNRGPATLVPRWSVLRPAAVLLTCLVGAGILALLLRTGPLLYYVRVHGSLLVTVVALAVLSIVLVTGVMVTTLGVSWSEIGRASRGALGRRLRRG